MAGGDVVMWRSAGDQSYPSVHPFPSPLTRRGGGIGGGSVITKVDVHGPVHGRLNY